MVDKAPGSTVNKTWCFWDDGKIESAWKDAAIIHHQWRDLFIKVPGKELRLQVSPYTYKMIRSSDFSRYCYNMISKARNVTTIYSAVTKIDEENGIVFCGEERFEAPIIFSSVLMAEPEPGKKDLYLLQHFKGYWIETEQDRFNDAAADLMNFRTSQQYGCTFLYVLPVSKRKALVEYTLFSGDTLAEEDYDTGLNDFIRNELKIAGFQITGQEKGIIPMTNYNFPKQKGRVFFIGTAGGQTKASTGYTFSFIQKQSAQIVNSLELQGFPQLKNEPKRFRFYDSVLLSILAQDKAAGAGIFFKMFERNKAAAIFKFLDNETSLAEELAIMNSTNKKIFIPAALQVWFQ